MRLWHYKLIPYLPNEMLVAQWRELIAIKRQWEKGTLKHRLVSYVKEHYEAKQVFYGYAIKVVEELDKRKIKYNEKLLKELGGFSEHICSLNNYPEHNDRYLTQCFYNLQEKYDRDIVSEKDWLKISDYYETYMEEKHNDK